MKLKAGDLVKGIDESKYYIINKVGHDTVTVDGNPTHYYKYCFELDDLCKQHNTFKTKEQVEMEKKQADAGFTTKPTEEIKQGKKDDACKAPISLIPSEYINGTAAVFGFGGKKYGLHNFRSGLNHSRCLDAAMRHLLAIASGEELDPESGMPHIYHASCSLAMYDYMRNHHPALNDVFEQVKKKGSSNG